MTDKKIYLADTISDEKDLLLRVAGGDEKAFACLFYEAVKRLRPALARFAAHEMNIEEVIQETFIKVWVNRDALPGIENIYGYIYRIAANSFAMHLRKEVADRKRDQNWHNDHQLMEDWSMINQSRLNEMKQVITEAVQAMPGRRKEIYLLSREQGLSIQEIAMKLNISPNTVKNTLISALSSIRDNLESAGYAFTTACVLIIF